LGISWLGSVDRIHSNHRVEWFDPPLATSFRRAARSAALFSGAATTGGVGRELEVRRGFSHLNRVELEVCRGFSHLNRAHASRSLGRPVESFHSLAIGMASQDSEGR